MIKIDGKKIREVRKMKKISQIDLAEGICKQATISNLERKNYCSSINILSEICTRLDITLEEVIINPETGKLKEVLAEVEKLCSIGKHKEAFDLIDEQTPSISELKKNQLFSKFFYYKGITNLLGKNEIERSVLDFQKIINYPGSEMIYRVLAINSIGIAFSMKGDNILANEYHRESIGMMKNLENPPLRLSRVYYNSAKFFSSQKQYSEALDLVDKGIEINKRHKSMDILDFLLYERAYNKFKLSAGKDMEDYKIASVVATLNDNTHLLKVIQSDLERESKGISL
ncbi:helix-turn-helix domain-containing protein [Enterococcus sp. DIV0876]|uniref:helix-turn-helix domain-containing protein n=1 Tax=Enterococcus sp. DIV0876 TaxID=2774633 RepID=UPI003D2FA2F9